MFSGTDVDGTIQSLTITSFPDNATSITIEGNTYTAGNFPIGGVPLTTNVTGQPTTSLPILVDPIDGNVSVVISYTVTDNNGLVSSNTGTVTLPLLVVPDVSPTITAQPNIMNGNTTFNLTIRVKELNVVNTNGLITVLVLSLIHISEPTRPY